MTGKSHMGKPPQPSGSENLDRRCAACLFAAFSFFYLLGLGGHIYTPDGAIMFNVARSLAFEARLDAQPIDWWPDFGGVASGDSARGRLYAKYGIGPSLAAVPLLWAGRLLLPLAGERETGLFAVSQPPFEFATGDLSRTMVSVRDEYYPRDPAHFDVAFTAFCASWLNALVVAGVVAGLFLCARRVGYAFRSCFGLAVAAGLATPLWHYSKEFFSEPLGALGLIWFVFFSLEAFRRANKARAWAWAGAMLGVSVLAKAAYVILLLPAAVPLVWCWGRMPRHAAIRGMMGFTLGLGGVAAIALAYNLARFGTLFETGYGRELAEWTTPFWEGVRGLLISPGRGLFIYAPAVGLGLLMMPRFAVRAPEWAGFGVLSLLTFVLFYARWYMWEGGWCWGPRFLVPILPALLLPLAALFDRPPTRSSARVAVAVVLAVSFAVALSGIMVGYHEYCRWLSFEYQFNETAYKAAGVTHYYDLMRWKWAFSPLVQYWVFPLKDYFLLPHAVRTPGLVLGLFVTWGVGLLISVVALARCVRSSSSSLARAGRPESVAPTKSVGP